MTFDYYVIYAGMRTGSNLLEDTLNGLPDIHCHGELFNPVFVGKQGQMSWLGMDMAAREADPVALITRMRSTAPGLHGFRLFHDHDPRILNATLADPRCGKIILTRNPLDSYISGLIAVATGQWLITEAKDRKSAKVRFDPQGFSAHLDGIRSFQEHIRRGLQHGGQTAFHIGYDDLKDAAVLTGLARFLGLQAEVRPASRLKPQNPGPATDKVTNPQEMAESLSRLDPFGLADVPNGEARRAAGVPGFIVGDDVPLMFMPVPGTDAERVRRWLETMGKGGKTVSGLTQKSLRQWMQGHPGFRSFVVVGHPVTRGWSAFRALADGGQPDLCRILSRHYGVNFPDPASDDAGEWGKGFERFLVYLKSNLAGQTGQKTEPAWASQSAILQGMAQFALPDMILREEGLKEGVSMLCAAAGIKPVPLPHTTRDTALLSRVVSPAIESAARVAYARDYAGFGFTDWRA
ncbi:MAG: nodulation protein NodH [Paracoccaceae bacterium]